MFSRISKSWFSRVRHPSDEELLGCLDGELDARHAARVKRHLETCWECRSRRRRMETAIEALARWRPARLGAEAAPPPKGWREFPIRLEQLASRPAETEPAGRRTLGPRFWKIAGAAAALAAVVLWLPEFGGFQLSAKELIAAMIRREAAVAASVENAVLHRTVRVSCTPPRFVPPGPGILESWHAPAKGMVRRDGNARLWAKLEPVFQANWMDREDALSAAAFRSWRAALADAADTLTKVRLEDGSDAWRLVTRNRSAAGRFAITEAELLVRASDWRPLRRVLRFRTPEGSVECEFITVRLEALPWSALPPSLFAETRPPAPPVKERESAGAPPAEKPAGQRTEIEVLYTLHRLGSCRGGGYELRRTDAGGLELRGVASSREEARQLSSALGDLPGLTLHIQIPEIEARGAPLEPSGPAPLASAAAEKIPAEQELRRLMAGADPQTAEREIAAYSTAVVALAQEAWADAWALHRLARRFPPASLSTLDRTPRWLVEAMFEDHAAALRRTLGRLQDRLRPLTGGAPAGGETRGVPAGLSAAELSQQILDAASEANTLSLELFTVSDVPALHRDVRSGLRRLLACVTAARAAAAGFQRLVAQSDPVAGSSRSEAR